MSMMWFSMLCKFFVVTTLHRAFIRKLVLALCHNRKWCHPGPRLKVLYPASSQVIKIQLYRKALSACRSTQLFAHPHLPVSHNLHFTLAIVKYMNTCHCVSTTHSPHMQLEGKTSNCRTVRPTSRLLLSMSMNTVSYSSCSPCVAKSCLCFYYSFMIKELQPEKEVISWFHDLFVGFYLVSISL